MRTAQELFDTVATHLIKQGKKSFSKETGYCLYRGPDGMKCAIGCLIPDSDYSIHFECNDLRQLLNSGKLPKNLVEEFTYCKSMLEELQRLHDNEEPNVWKKRLADIAKRYFKP